MDNTLKNALSILSKSSQYAVSTIREVNKNNIDELKNYLYIETDAQKDLEEVFSRVHNNIIVFVCGSSGDGKSELLTRYKKQYGEEYLFHLDGTHSYSPNETAIHALNKRFSEFKSSEKPLIIGINTGMLANYVAEGLDDHSDIKESIKDFLRGSETNQDHIFIDFSNRSILAEGDKSFALKLIKKLTDPVESNPFYQLFLFESNSLTSPSILHVNYGLLSNVSIQEKIEELIEIVRLKFDQFITARAVLDLIYELLSDKNYLFDVLFTESESELLRQMNRFDPSQMHSYEIDQFKLQFNLNILNPEIKLFIDSCQKNWGVFAFNSADSVLRFMLMIQSDKDVSTDVKNIISPANQSVILDYKKIWRMHKNYSEGGSSKQELNIFYRETVVSAIQRYCNRHAQELTKGQYYLYELNGYKVACDLDIKFNFASIAANKPNEASFFYACFIVNGQAVRPIPINFNLLDLLKKINNGYRPNKQDKNAILILDEIVDLVRDIGISMNTLYIYHNDEKLKVTNENDEYYEASGF